MSSAKVPAARLLSLKVPIVVAGITFIAALATDETIFWVLFFIWLLLLPLTLYQVKFNPAHAKSAEKLGLTLGYNYRNVLGIDEKNGKVYVATDKPRAFDKNQIRKVETDSIHQVKYNAWGHGFHKDKNCKLVIHVDDLEQPIHVVEFDKKDEMDKWFSRLSVFCELA